MGEQEPEQRGSQIVATVALWGVILLAGGGLWIFALDPFFGGQEALVAGLTIFGFFVGLGILVSLDIWWKPARPIVRSILKPTAADGARSPTLAHVLGWLGFWALTLTLIVYAVKNQWHPVVVGLGIGGLSVLRVVGEIALNRWRS
jgi:hypothetical protein